MEVDGAGWRWVRLVIPIKQSKKTLSVMYKYNSNYNHEHNILKLFDTLPNFIFTTNEMKRDY